MNETLNLYLHTIIFGIAMASTIIINPYFVLVVIAVSYSIGWNAKKWDYEHDFNEDFECDEECVTMDVTK